MDNKNTFLVNCVLATILVALLGTNQYVFAKIYLKMGKKMPFISKAMTANSQGLTGNATDDAIKLVISQGQPDVYGAELGVTFDQVQRSMDIMKEFDPGYGSKKILLSGEDLSRYTDIGLRISCEYCCGAKSIVFNNGEAACGCAHSQAMRGLIAYLIQNHKSEYTNDEILRELARWKGMFFPKQMIQKMAGHLQNGNFTPDTASLLMEKKLPDYGKGSISAPAPTDLNNLPNMVGGC